MLSYMLPIEEKPPLGPSKGHLQLVLASQTATNGKPASLICKDHSISSFLSDAGTISQSSMTPTNCSERKPKLAINGTKHQPLKRVSFGSSKGSMVETLIYENRTLDDCNPSPITENPPPRPNSPSEKSDTDREKVRVTFFQQSKPQEVDLPNEPLFCTNSPPITMETNVNEINHQHTNYTVHQSVENGWDNPFRPGGNLSKEADEIVELIKGGKPITPTSGNTPNSVDESDAKYTNSRGYVPVTESPKKAAASPLNAVSHSTNGKVKGEKTGPVDVQRGTVMPDASQVEHVVIKKKPKCECCVIQ